MDREPQFAFSNILAQPGYGERTIGLTWNALPAFSAGDVYVYRSVTGLPPWTLLNEDNPVPADIGYYVDFVPEIVCAQFTQLHYRLSLELNSEVYNSPIIDPIERLNGREQKIIFKIMRQELRNMHSRLGGNGIAGFMFAPLRSGIPVPGYDFQTKQMGGTGMANPKFKSYGQQFVGGFGTPALTWIMKLGAQTLNFSFDPEGNSIAEQHPQSARLLAFPRPMPDYLIVLPSSDERFVVAHEGIEPFLFRGVYPIAYEVKLNILRKTDPRYQVPVPEIPKSMFR